MFRDETWLIPAAYPLIRILIFMSQFDVEESVVVNSRSSWGILGLIARDVASRSALLVCPSACTRIVLSLSHVHRPCKVYSIDEPEPPSERRWVQQQQPRLYYTPHQALRVRMKKEKGKGQKTKEKRNKKKKKRKNEVVERRDSVGHRSCRHK